MHVSSQQPSNYCDLATIIYTKKINALNDVLILEDRCIYADTRLHTLQLHT